MLVVPPRSHDEHFYFDELSFSFVVDERVRDDSNSRSVSPIKRELAAWIETLTEIRREVRRWPIGELELGHVVILYSMAIDLESERTRLYQPQRDTDDRQTRGQDYLSSLVSFLQHVIDVCAILLRRRFPSEIEAMYACSRTRSSVDRSCLNEILAGISIQDSRAMLAAWLPTFNSSSNSWDPVLGTVPGYRYKRRLGYATEADETVEEAISASYELSEIFTLLARSILGQTSYASVPVSQTPLST